MIRYVIISYPRTGSTYLVKVLNSCSNIICHSEIFHTDYKSFSRSFLDNSVLPKLDLFDKIKKLDVIEKLFKLRNTKPLKFLDHIFSTNADAVGFKIFPGQNDRILEYLIRDTSVRKIILNRKNLVRSYVSEQLAMESGRWDRYKNEQISLPTKVNISIDEFERYVNSIKGNISKIENQLSYGSQPFLKISYEDIFTQFPARKISDFLGVDFVNMSFDVDQEKQNPFPLNEMIENYEEFESALQETNWRQFLYQP